MIVILKSFGNKCMPTHRHTKIGYSLVSLIAEFFIMFVICVSKSSVDDNRVIMQSAKLFWQSFAP